MPDFAIAGYEHVWTIHTAGLQAEWTRAIMAIPKILRATDVPLSVNFRDDAIIINGDGECDEPRHCLGDWRLYPPTREPHSAAGDDLVVPTVLVDAPKLGFTFEEEYNSLSRFCRTDRRPYDVLVTAILAALEHLSLDFWLFLTEGSPNDWEAGVALAREALADGTICAPFRAGRPEWPEEELRWELRRSRRKLLLAELCAGGMAPPAHDPPIWGELGFINVRTSTAASQE